jgi:ketosteroid isomerase-like protein
MSANDGAESQTGAIRELIENWAAAVRRRDYDGILRDHADDIVMFDVPPPLESRGLAAYRATWDLFFSWTERPVPFAIQRLEITAGEDVAFAVALLRCAEPDSTGGQKPLDFRLTLGLRKIGQRWTITHEHHSVPA